ncbi:B12-binding domain-containing radical SAM protein [Acetobacterium wieringae]|uniref:B12-binding domain-containing radical SAM protein n=1 Tax=Acetobacterium wieringae TaxID=52694 RepID=UPI0026F1A8E3|nr:B12-binding domain-containing radical SAM protein [Acetobacterium wieringae]
MKDLVLVAINAKYIHTNLAVRSLKAQLPDFDVEIVETSINDPFHRIVKLLLDQNTRRIGFSCYIWNMEMVLKLAEVIKKANPLVQIIFGGPEVSFDGAALLQAHPFCDLIIQGEGEAKLKALLECSNRREGLKTIPGLCYRNSMEQIFTIPDTEALPLSQLVFPYINVDMASLTNKIIYYETMRGCPFCCAYCLSSAKQGLNMLGLDRVFAELDFFIESGVKQVKLVDRTFNCDISRAKRIFNHMIERGGTTNFHFEMTGDLIDDEMLDLLTTAPPGLIQFEIGVQSTSPETLSAIGRKISVTRTAEHVKRMLVPQNIHIHLDLIAGLPFESYDIFRESFNQVIALGPDMLQLGFLKCLKGTRIRNEAEIHQYQYASYPPYEIISNKYISAEELYQLRQIEVLVDRYYNSGVFKQSMNYIFEDKIFLTPFEFFERFSCYWEDQGYYDVGKSKEQIFGILHDFFKDHQQVDQIDEWLRYDWLAQGNFRMPMGMSDQAPDKEWIFEFLKEPHNIHKYLADFIDLAPKKIYNQVKFQYFSAAFLSRLSGASLSTADQPGLVLFTATGLQSVIQ